MLRLRDAVVWTMTRHPFPARPFMRGIMMLAFLSFFIVTVATTPAGTSHVSHAGGFLCGLFPSFLFLPNLRRSAARPLCPALCRADLVCAARQRFLRGLNSSLQTLLNLCRFAWSAPCVLRGILCWLRSGT